MRVVSGLTLLVAAIAIAALAIARAPVTGAALDLTGDWTYTMAGDFEGACRVVLVQAGEDLTGSFDCPGYEDDGTLEGRVTLVGQTLQLDASITLYAGSVVVAVWDTVATVLPAGNTVSGQWASDAGSSGTLVGMRDVPIYIKGDVNCDGEVNGADVLSGMLWSLDLDPLQQPDCPEIGADLGVIFADVDCDLEPASSDGVALLWSVAGFDPGLPAGCLAIGEMYSPVIPTSLSD